jgi:hypothetical protein
MRYDLSFWPELDWRRESSIDPRFLAAVGASTVALAIFAAWSFLYSSLQAARNERSRTVAANEKIKSLAMEVAQKNEMIRHWQGIDARLQRKPKVRMPWSRQLAALTEVVPDTVIISSVSVRSNPVKVEVSDAPAVKPGAGAASGSRRLPVRPKTVLRLQYDLTLTGVAVGDSADDVVSRFSREIPQHPEIGSWLESVELTSLQPDANAFAHQPGKKFSIVCRYKPLDWYDESVPSRHGQ